MSFLVTVVMLVLVFDCGNCNMQRFEAAKSIRVEDSAFILHRDSRSNHRYRRSVLNSTEMQEALEAHNRLRRLEGASDMEIMIWDNDLATKASVSADKCIWNHTNTGQNLYSSNSQSPINLTAAIEAWYNEKQYYSYWFINGICQEPQQQCLHYSQVVWATSRKLGCAYTRCTTLQFSTLTNALILVCNYDPPGNIQGVKPYQSGAMCSACVSGSLWCNNGLCDGTCTTSAPTCACNLVCNNNGTLNQATCSCSCAPEWYGTDCTALVVNYSTSMKPSLLNILSVWLSWLLICIFRST